MSERLEEMLECYKRHKDDEDLYDMIAVLRDRFLDYEVLNEKYDYDISGELACGPEHVVFYISKYIDMLEQQNKRLRESIDKALGEGVYSDCDNAIDKMYGILGKALEESE